MASNADRSDLNEAARRAANTITEQIDTFVERAEWDAEAIRRQAEHDADGKRREAFASARRLLDRIEALEFPLGELVMDIRDEIGRIHQELERGEQAAPLPGAGEPPRLGNGRRSTSGKDRHDLEEQIGSERTGWEIETIRRKAGHEAQGQLQEAASSGERLLARIEALEFPLGALVTDLRQETDRMARELEDGPAVEAEAAALPVSRHEQEVAADDPQPVEAEPADEEPPEAELEALDQTPAPHQRPRGQKPTPPSSVPSQTKGEEAGAGVLGRLRPKRAKAGGSPAPGTECAICQRPFADDGHDASDWKLSGDVALCPDCQADGWQLPAGARLPLRAGRR